MADSCDPLTDEQLEQLDTYLLSAAVPEEALDYIALHGYLCALAVSPAPIAETEWLNHVLAAEEATQPADPAMIKLIQQEYAYIRDCLESDTSIELPCDLTLELDDEGDCLLEYWAQGFMELVFSQEQAWFSQHEDVVAESLLPFMLAANLDEDDELSDLRLQTKLCQQLCEQIPELVQDLFLLFRVPADSKPKGGKPGAKGPKGKGPKGKGGKKPRHH